MKSRPFWLLVLIMVVSCCVSASAEYVFKKDGSIIRGAIVSDDAGTISVKKEGGEIERVNRSDILRTIYVELYLGKVFARLTTGEVIEGYQIDEDRDDFIFRKDITKPEEFKIPRRRVMFIARTNPTDLSGTPSTGSISMKWSPPFKPAKFYRIYFRDVKGGEEKFRMIGETDELSFEIKDLKKSWIYEIYATAVSEAGEESLPSEKAVVNTLPDAPGGLVLAENLSEDGKTVTITFKWKNVTDSESRVKTYNVYETTGGERVKKGSSGGDGFVLKDFPAEGRHRFAVVAVNDLFTESADLMGIYDAGYKIYIRGSGSYVYPMGVMSELASAGYGALIDFGISWKKYSIGIETGYFIFSVEEEIESMAMLPVLLEFDYSIFLFHGLSFRPVIKGGGSYDMIEYVEHVRKEPLESHTSSSNNFDPVASGGAYLQYDITENINVFAGAEYSVIFQKTDRMSYSVFSAGAGIVF